MKCSCYTNNDKPCSKEATYKMILRHNNQPFYCCSTHIKQYLDKTKSYYYSVKNIEKI